MSLTGALEAFPLPDVLQLLSRSRKSGMLRVMAKGVEGRIYFQEGELTYGTTRPDDGLGADAVRAGLLDEQGWSRVERQGASLTEAADAPNGEVARFVAEHIHDTMFRLLRLERGNFEFIPEMRPRFDTGQLVSVDSSLSEAERRLAEWRGIEELIPGMDFRLTLAPSIEAQEVTVSAESWRVLAGLRGTASVADLAARLGSTDFRVAKIMADLVREGVVILVDQVAAASEVSPPPAPRPEESVPHKPEITIVRDSPEDEPGEETEPEIAAEDDADEASLLRVALSGVMSVDEEGGEGGEGEEQPMLRRRGLGSIAREWRSE